MTEKLYERDGALRVFTARVLACEAAPGGFAVVLDRTAFFPEGGGQPGDRGRLGGAAVKDTHVREGVVRHLTDAPLEPGREVTGEVDDAFRREMTQQHSGEHIFSGLVHGLFGYDNVGFRIGAEEVTMDFSGPMTWEDAMRVERLANEAVWADRPVEVFVPSPEELARLEYRSKKALEGPVRIVRIEGADCCACCGMHVKRTGEIGQIKVVGLMNYKGGVRVSIRCGVRALRYENAMLDAMREAARLLSAKPEELPERVRGLEAERDGLRRAREEIALRLFEAEAARETGEIRVVQAELAQPGKAAARLASGAKAALVVCPQGEGFRFALCSEAEDVRPATRALLSRFGGKGGGPKDLTQGVFSGGTPGEFRAALREALG